MSIWDYNQNLTKRVINDPSLDRFIWMQHNFSTKYIEPYTYIQMNDNQGMTLKTENRPYRSFELSFPLLHLKDSTTAGKSWLDSHPELDFGALRSFYLAKGLHRKFIYPHPVYGDMVVRFAKALSMPKKNIEGTGTVQPFTLALVEVVTTDYMYFPSETFFPELPYQFVNNDVEIKYPADAGSLGLGKNYQITFRDTQPPVRKFTVTLPAMKYYVAQGTDMVTMNTAAECRETNMWLLEMFYMKYRLSKPFVFNYLDEDINVQFMTPLEIPNMVGNAGLTDAIVLNLIEYIHTPELTLTIPEM